MENSALARTAYLACLLFACSHPPSRAPLGGNYALPEPAPAADRHAQAESSPTEQPDSARTEPKEAKPEAPSSKPKTVDSSALTKTAPADTLRFQPLQAGSRIQAEVTLNTSAEIRGAMPGMPDNVTFAVDSRLRADIELLKVSAQSVDELTLKLTTLAMHAEFAGQATDSKQEPPETYRITLSGGSPTIRGSSGSKVELEDRVKIALFIVPLAEFYAHWAGSPTLELKPGWSSKVSLPMATTLFATTSDEAMRVGPLSTRFTSRPERSDEVPFELKLPVEYSGKLGKISFDLSGSAKLSAKSARPTSFELSGPLNATGGPHGSQLSLAGKAQLTCTLSYP